MHNDFFKLMLITDKQNLAIKDYLAFICSCAKAGITALQLREKNLNQVQLIKLAKRIQPILKKYKIPLIINDNINTCLAVNAEGVHLGQLDGDINYARKALGPNKIIGLSANTIQQIKLANTYPISYIGVGPIFASNNKPNVDVFDTDHLNIISQLSMHPLIAIGGVNENNASQLMLRGFSGIAAIDAFHKASSPLEITMRLRYIIENRLK